MTILKPLSPARAVWESLSVPIVLAIVLLPFLLTYVLTSIQAWARARSNAPVKTPPIVPYWVPFIGSGISFGWNMLNFLSQSFKTYGDIPFEVHIPSFMNMYYVTGAENVAHMFKASRELSTKKSMLMALNNAWGMPIEDNGFIEADDSGIQNQPLPGSNVDPKLRWDHTLYKTLRAYLMGTSLDSLADRFVSNLSANFEKCDIGKEWVELPDFYEFMKRELFHASMLSACGPHILRLNSTLNEDFWAFDAAVPFLLAGAPRWLYKSKYRARDTFFDDVLRWMDHGDAHLDWNDPAQRDADYEEYYGARVMRARQYDFSNFPISRRGAAANHVGMLWATNANVIPAAFWSVYHTFFSPTLLSDVRDIVRTTVPGATTLNSKDVQTLSHNPLLQSMYAEALRVYTSIMTQRSPVDDNFKVGGWTFPKDAMILMSSWHEARRRDAWNTGLHGEHPVDEFWAERFIVYPNDPSSGPAKVAPAASVKPSTTIPTESTFQSTIPRAPRNTTDGVANSWIPYGGGMKHCPGRFFAKQEMVAAVAIMVSMFDIELVDAKQVQPDMSYFAFGAMPPKGKIAVRIRRRG